MEATGAHPTHHSTHPPVTFTHTAQFYDDTAAMVTRASDLVAEALGSAGAALVLATADHRAAIDATLAMRGYDLTGARQTGRWIELDADEIRDQIMVDGHVDTAEFNAIVGASLRRASTAMGGNDGAVTVFGELVALLAAEGNHDEAIEIERCWNALSRDHTFTLHCGYPMTAFDRPGDSEALAHICDAHSAVEPVESYTSLPTHDDQTRMIVMLQQKAHALGQEVAARARAEQALREQYRELQAALVARDEFLAVAAHELRTPMTGLRGNAQLLRRIIEAGRETSPERMRRALRAIENQSLKLDHLITRLLDASQIEAGTLRLSPATTDLAALVQSMIAHQPPRDSHQIVYEGPDRLDTEADALRLGQAITNLIDNAVRYSPEGGLVAVRMASDPDGIEISVTDSGPGIPAERRNAVFTSYREARGSRSFTGIGLGLFVSRQIVEMHGGSMRIEEPAHRGTRIVITLPAAPSPVDEAMVARLDAD